MSRQIEFTEEAKIGLQTYYPGDRKTFPDDIGDAIFNAGWGKDVATGKQKERNLSPVTVELADSSQQLLRT